MKTSQEAGQAFQQLVELMDTLREQCPWDQKQTIQSLQKYTIEELYELMDAINDENANDIKEELGDVLFHTLFYSKIESEQGHFTITDVIDTVHEKLVRRHPHIFGDVLVENENEVKKNWEAIKLAEGKSSVLEGVPKSLPSIIKAFRMQQKAAQVGFDWDNHSQVLDKVDEEYLELKEAMESQNKKHIEEEFGDLLFSLVNLSRFLDIDPEISLERANQKFKKRFLYIENKAKEENLNIHNQTLDFLEQWWQEAKESER